MVERYGFLRKSDVLSELMQHVAHDKACHLFKQKNYVNGVLLNILLELEK